MLFFFKAFFSLKVCEEVIHNGETYLIVTSDQALGSNKMRIIASPDKNFKHCTKKYDFAMPSNDKNLFMIKLPDNMEGNYIKLEAEDKHCRKVTSKPTNLNNMKPVSVQKFFSDPTAVDEILIGNSKNTNSSNPSKSKKKNGNRDHYEEIYGNPKNNDSADKTAAADTKEGGNEEEDENEDGPSSKSKDSESDNGVASMGISAFCIFLVFMSA